MVLLLKEDRVERKRTDTIPHYDLEALKQNVEKCNKNIVLFQDAIEKEYKNKVELLALIKETEETK